MALVTIKTMMKQDNKFSSQVMSSPYLKTLLEMTEKNIPMDYYTLLLRYVQLRLVQAVFVLLRYETGSLMELVFPYNYRIELSADHDEKNRLVFHVNTYRSGTLDKSYTFWVIREFIIYLIGVFMKNFPKKISVFRSSLPISSVPVHKFLVAVSEEYDTTIPKKLFRLYDQNR